MKDLCMVPREPTDAMVSAGLDALADSAGGISDTYKAMLNAAPPCERLTRLLEIESAAENLIRVKGRYHTEQAMKRLMEVFGAAA